MSQSLRSKILDKYWLEFLKFLKNYDEALEASDHNFWRWLYHDKPKPKKLEDYLK